MLCTAEMKPTTQEKQTKEKQVSSKSSQLSPKKSSNIQGDNSNLGATGISSDSKQSKSVGNPGWSTKIETPMIKPSTSSSISTGETLRF